MKELLKTKILKRLRSWHLAPFSSVQSLSHVRLFVTPWTAAPQASLSITSSRSLLKHMSIESVPHYFMANRRGKGGSSDRVPLLGL